jgi:hypothetical protein
VDVESVTVAAGTFTALKLRVNGYAVSRTIELESIS